MAHFCVTRSILIKCETSAFTSWCACVATPLSSYNNLTWWGGFGGSLSQPSRNALKSFVAGPSLWHPRTSPKNGPLVAIFGYCPTVPHYGVVRGWLRKGPGTKNLEAVGLGWERVLSKPPLTLFNGWGVFLVTSGNVLQVKFQAQAKVVANEGVGRRGLGWF